MSFSYSTGLWILLYYLYSCQFSSGRILMLAGLCLRLIIEVYIVRGGGVEFDINSIVYFLPPPLTLYYWGEMIFKSWKDMIF